MLTRLFADPAVLLPLEVVLPERALADADGSARPVVVVVAGVLSMGPADQPDVDARVAVQLVVDALVRVVALEWAPEPLFLPEGDGELAEFGAVEVVVGGEPFTDPGRDVRHRRKEAGLSMVRIFSTDSPKPLMARKVCAGSTTGLSLP